jgi:hypothetical protein
VLRPRVLLSVLPEPTNRNTLKIRLSHEVNPKIHRRRIPCSYRSTFPAYEFTGYSIDGKPAISSFKELCSVYCPLRGSFAGELSGGAGRIAPQSTINAQ